MRTFKQYVIDEKKRRGVEKLTGIAEGERTRFYTPSGDIPSVDVEAMGPNLQYLVNNFQQIFSAFPPNAGNIDNIKHYAPIVSAALADIKKQLADFKDELSNPKDMNDFVRGYFFAAISIAEKKLMRENPEFAKQSGAHKQIQLSFLKGLLDAVEANPRKNQDPATWDYQALHQQAKASITQGAIFRGKISGLEDDLKQFAEAEDTLNIIGTIAKFLGDGKIGALGPEGLNEIVVAKAKLVQEERQRQGKPVPDVLVRVVKEGGFTFSEQDKTLLVEVLKENPSAFQLNLFLSVTSAETIADMFNQVAVHHLPKGDFKAATHKQVANIAAFLEKNQLFMHNTMAKIRPGQVNQIVFTAALSSIYAKDADTQLERIMKMLPTAHEQEELYDKLMEHVNNDANFEHAHKRWDKWVKKEKTDTQIQAIKALEALEPKLNARIMAEVQKLEQQKIAQEKAEAAKREAEKENTNPQADSDETRAKRWNAERSNSAKRTEFKLGAGRGGQASKKRAHANIDKPGEHKVARAAIGSGQGRGRRIDRRKRTGMLIRSSSQEDLLNMNRQELRDYLTLQSAIEKKEYPSRRRELTDKIESIKEAIAESYYKEPHTQDDLQDVLTSGSRKSLEDLKVRLEQFHERAQKEGDAALVEAHKENLNAVDARLEQVISAEQRKGSGRGTGV